MLRVGVGQQLRNNRFDGLSGIDCDSFLRNVLSALMQREDERLLLSFATELVFWPRGQALLQGG